MRHGGAAGAAAGPRLSELCRLEWADVDLLRKVALVRKAKGKKPKVVPEHIRRITDNRTFDISKARKELGFAPKIGYDEAAKEMVEEYLKGKENTKA